MSLKAQRRRKIRAHNNQMRAPRRSARCGHRPAIAPRRDLSARLLADIDMVGSPEGRDQTCQLGPGLPRLPPPITVVPFISQIAISPLSF